MRMRMSVMGLVAGLGLALASSSCDPATAVALPALIITNSWSVEGQANRYFQFNSNDDGQDHGTFTGSEFVDDVEVNTLTGTWSEGYLQFNLSDGTVFSGTFDELPDRLVVSSSSETLVLVRG